MTSHLLLWPIVIPLLGGAVSLFLEHRRFSWAARRATAWAFMALLAVAVGRIIGQADTGTIGVYLLGDWPARLGIALMADRLSGWMLGVTLLLGGACLLHACSGWDRRAPHFHAFFQLQLMGLNGAFLTGDIFNLFVFFEVMLSASYGLLISGGRGLRMRSGFHYVAFNVAASALFLIALGLIYGLLGSLNMAELSVRVGQVAPAQAGMVKAAFALLLLVFCAKAALLPLYLWLPETYSRAPAAVAALFAVMTKVGLYAVLRVSTLLLGAQAGALAGFGQQALLWAGAGTLLLGALGVLGAARLRIMIGYVVIWSAATLFIAFALGRVGTIGAGLYYLAHSTFVAAALFMAADLIRRRRGHAEDDKSIVAALPDRALPGAMFLVAAISAAGLPPLSGFLAKAALLSDVPVADTPLVWSVVLLSSLLVIIGISRAGVRLFWRLPAQVAHVEEDHGPGGHLPVARARPNETWATLLLLGLGVGMTLFAAPLMQYTDAAARQLLQPGDYTQQLRETAPAMRTP
ncbi:monovalent cation/H+ antiporter subunit D [Pseudoxanthomonas composti]|uniref:Monovalent cation/H+ antiporter subunit D n=1 Tax=Pseudoxanthomonas composti TaxID=2137479 RepID=A0A4Q1JUQ6_9GAMM|nr:monovalent cation/H+ antiporter subunit D [Pseudoxanthomonas composti]RXR02707.1 monovalent cation/H+ antiporter subunit D [Pseudoxanthomonas composti]